MKSKIIFFAALACSLALAVICGYVFCTGVTLGSAGRGALAVLYVALVFVSIVVCDLLHEGAHIAVGVLCRMGVRPDRYRIFRTSSVNVNPLGGRHMRGRMAATCIAGVAVNLICAVAGIILLFAGGNATFFAIPAPYSLYLFIINAIPDDCGGAKNDGMIFLELVTNSPSSRVMVRILEIEGIVRAGTGIADVPRNMLFDLPQLPEDDINFIILTRLRYEYFLQRGDEGEAEKYLSRFNELCDYLPTEYRGQLAPSARGTEEGEQH